MSNDSLLNRAIVNYNAAAVLLDNLAVDELFVNQIACNIQQSYEMAIKYLLELNGVEYPKTHDIDQLIRIANSAKVNIFISDYLDEHSEMISQWEAKARYVMGYLVELRKIERAMADLKDYLEKIKTELSVGGI